MKATHDTPFHAKARATMKKNYYENGGRIKSILKYYKNKFSGDEGANAILVNDELSLEEKLQKMKIHNFRKKLESVE